METIICPYCECRVRVSDVDDEGGVCPECGAIITSSHLVEQDRELEDDDEVEETDVAGFDDDEDDSEYE